MDARVSREPDITNEELFRTGPAEGGAYLFARPARIPAFLQWLTNKLANQSDGSSGKELSNW